MALAWELQVFARAEILRQFDELTTDPCGVGRLFLKGDRGDTGLSAYQIALQNGFVGSQEEWLASLVGGEGGSDVDIGEPETDEQFLAPFDGLLDGTTTTPTTPTPSVFPGTFPFILA